MKSVRRSVSDDTFSSLYPRAELTPGLGTLTGRSGEERLAMLIFSPGSDKE